MESSLDIGREDSWGGIHRSEGEVSYLSILGCLVYTHVLKEKRTILEPCRKEDTFVDTMRLQRLIGSTFQDIVILRLVRMLPLIRSYPSRSIESLIWR